MIETVLVLIAIVFMVLLALWVNQLAKAIHALNLRLVAIEARTTTTNDPVSNFKTL